MRSFNPLLILGLSLFVVTLMIVAVIASGAPISLGQNIPQSDLMSDYAYGFILAVGCYVLLLLFPVSFSDRIALSIAWSVKIAVVLVFMLFYEDFYSSLDAYDYFSSPRSSSFSWDGFSIGQGTDNIHNLIWFCYRLFPESFHALKVLFSFIGLIAVYFFYRAAVLFLGRPSLRFFYALALFPSMLFWSSIIGKDPITLFGIGLFAYGTVSWYKHGKPHALVLLGTGVLVAMLVRAWLGPILLLPLFVGFLFTRRGLLAKGLVSVLVAGGLAYTLTLVGERFAIETTQDLLEGVESTSRPLSGGGSGQEFAADLSQPSQLVSALPLAMFTALFRPLPGEVSNIFGTLAGIESLALLVLLAVAIARFRFTELKNPVLVWAITLVLAWTLAYAFISYQNLGGAVRFRLQILPVLLALLLYFSHRKTSERSISRAAAQPAVSAAGSPGVPGPAA